MRTYFIRVMCFFVSIIAVNFLGYQNDYTKIADEQRATYDVESISTEIINSIKADDASILEKYMCKNIKDNTVNLTGEIQKLIDAVGGEITSWDLSATNGWISKTVDGYGCSELYGFSIQIHTTQDDYLLWVRWCVVQNVNLEETGIRVIGLHRNEPEYISNLDGTYERIFLAKIEQTEDTPYPKVNITDEEDLKNMINYIKSSLNSPTVA